MILSYENCCTAMAGPDYSVCQVSSTVEALLCRVAWSPSCLCLTPAPSFHRSQLWELQQLLQKCRCPLHSELTVQACLM